MTHYIARARCREVKAFDGTILTHDDKVVTLGTSDGYAQCIDGIKGVYEFASAEEARASAHRWDGMPWYCQLKPGSLMVFRVTQVEKLVPTMINVETEVTE
jgi:hypothetical protein